MLNKLGGAGTYATMGARLFRPRVMETTARQPSNVGFTVHVGSDFPPEVRATLESWNTSSLMIQTPERLTTRGKNVYNEEMRGR